MKMNRLLSMTYLLTCGLAKGSSGDNFYACLDLQPIWVPVPSESIGLPSVACVELGLFISPGLVSGMGVGVKHLVLLPLLRVAALEF